MTPPKIVVQIDNRTEAALLQISAERTLATGKRATTSDIVREALRCYLAAHDDGEDVDAILTDLVDDNETYDVAKARILAWSCKEGLAMLGGWIRD